MSIKTYRPITPARRHMTVSGFDGVDKHAAPEKSLVEVKKKNAGRNNYGRITVRHHGGGNRQKYRIIDFKRDKRNVEAQVLRLEYDPNRSAYIALVEYPDSERRYILAPVGLAAGDVIVAGEGADIKPGNALPLANIPVVPLSTTSKCTRARVRSSSAPRATPRSLWRRRALSRPSVCRPAKCARSA